MFGRPALYRNGALRPENLGQNALTMVSNLGFILFVVVVLVFTIIAARYEPEDPLFNSATELTAFLTSTSNATFKTDSSVIKTGEDFMSPNQTMVSSFINVTELENPEINPDTNALDCDPKGPLDCRDPEVFHMMIKATIDKFKDIHFYKFGKPVLGGNDSSCDMAWRFRPKDGKTASFYKDYRRFVIFRSDNCTVSIESIGGYHSGQNARKRRKKIRQEIDNASENQDPGFSLPVVGEAVNDSLPVVESENMFSHRKYLIYEGGGDRCKSMNHYLWSFLCSLGEAQYLNRTLVMDLSLCLSSTYTSSGQNEEGKDFRFYFDFEHLKDGANVLDKDQFWRDWNKWQKKHKLNLHLVEDFRVTPMKLADVKDTLIMRKFGSVEPDNYWYRVCEGETESVIQRPWHLLWKSRRLMDIVSAISSRLNWDYDSVHVERGEKVSNTKLWPNLARDTSPDSLITALEDKIEEGRFLYVATNEPVKSFFNPLRDKWRIQFLDDYYDLWAEDSEWYSETMKLNNGIPVEFDGYMRISVDTEVFLRGKKQVETFNDLTRDCKDGAGSCNSASS